MATSTKKTEKQKKSGRKFKNPFRFLSGLGRRLRSIPGGVVNGFSSLRNFFSAAINEMKLVEWLSRSETLRFSGFVIGFIVVTAIVVALLDLLFFRGLVIITAN